MDSPKKTASFQVEISRFSKGAKLNSTSQAFREEINSSGLSLPPQEICCEMCQGYGDSDLEICGICPSCTGSGVDYEKLIRWLAAPNNDPAKAYFTAWDYDHDKWINIPVSILVERWILDQKYYHTVYPDFYQLYQQRSKGDLTC